MSSSEEYLDSLLESILNGGKPKNAESMPVEQNTTAADTLEEVADEGSSRKGSANANKAMSPEEIEEMLKSMGTLGGEEKSSTETMGIEDALVDMGTEEVPTDDLGLDSLEAAEEVENGFLADSLGTDGTMSDELSLDDLSLDDLPLDDMGTEEVPTDDLGLDNLGVGEADTDGLLADSLGTDGTISDELSLDDLSLDDLSLDDMGTEDAMQEDISLDDLSLDDLSLDNLSLDDMGAGEETADNPGLNDLEAGETGIDDLLADSLGTEGASQEDISLDDLSLDDLGLDDLGLEAETTDDLGADSLQAEDVSSDDLSLDDLAVEDFGTEEPLSEDLSLDDLSIGEDSQEESNTSSETDDLDSLLADMNGELSLDDLSMGEETMSEEDIDRLLSGEDIGGTDSIEPEEESTVSDDFALEETGEEDEDLSALLAGMNHDEDLSEINDLLEKSDQGVPADDDMLAMLGEGDNNAFDFFADDNTAKEAANIREISPEELEERDNPKGKKEKKKRKKKEKKPRKQKGAEEETTAENSETDELESLLGNTPEEEQDKPKKQGFGAKLMALLFEGDEDENPAGAEEDEFSDSGLQMGSLTDENKEILQELSDEDKKNSKKKGKKDKKKKKGKKGKGDGEEAIEGEEGEEAEQVEKKPKKKKKKKKEETEEDLLALPEKKLSKKKVMTVFLFCGTMAACIILITSFLPNYMQKHDARIAYDHGYYGDVYDLLYGKKLNEEDEILFRKSNLILQMDRKINSYENYNKMGMRLEALDALISGVARYQELLPRAEQYNVTGEVRSRYEQIIDNLSADFGVSESDALDIIASEDDVEYSQRLQDIINGVAYGAEEDMPEVKQDVLLEEEEIISRLEDVEQADGSDN